MIDLDAHRIPRLEPFRRIEPCPDPRRRSSIEDIARLQREPLAGVGNHRFDREHVVARVVDGERLAVEGALDVEVVGVGHLVGGGDPGTHRAEGVGRLGAGVVDEEDVTTNDNSETEDTKTQPSKDNYNLEEGNNNVDDSGQASLF